MKDDSVLVEERAGALWVVFNRPDDMNPMDQPALETLEAAWDRARDTEPVAVVITGRGRAFSAGADLKSLRNLLADGMTPEFDDVLGTAPTICRKMEQLPVPVIAGVNGLCVAGGMELICAADLVIAAESARIADGHGNYGLLPMAGTAHRLARRVGLSNAKRLLFTGEFVSADEALRMGLVNWIVPDGTLDQRLTDICKTLAKKSPRVLKKMKMIADQGASATLEEAATFENRVGRDHFASDFDIVREGLAAFVERREPSFREMDVSGV